LVAEKHVVYLVGPVAAASLGGERRGTRSALRRPVAWAIEQRPEITRATGIARGGRRVAQVSAVRSRPAKRRYAGKVPRVGAGAAQSGRQAAHAVIAASNGAGTSCA
jgi:hypothetical protein